MLIPGGLDNYGSCARLCACMKRPNGALTIHLSLTGCDARTHAQEIHKDPMEKQSLNLECCPTHIEIHIQRVEALLEVGLFFFKIF